MMFYKVKILRSEKSIYLSVNNLFEKSYRKVIFLTEKKLACKKTGTNWKFSFLHNDILK